MIWPSLWWIEAVVRPLTSNWSSTVPISTQENLVKVYREQNGFLNAPFIDAYLVKQPALLSALVFLALLGLVIFFLTGTICFAKFLGFCQIKKLTTIRSPVHCLIIVFCLSLFVVWLSHSSLTLDFVVENFASHTNFVDKNNYSNNNDLKQLPAATLDDILDAKDKQRSERGTEERNRHVMIQLSSIVIKNKENQKLNDVQRKGYSLHGGGNLITLFNSIRELSFEFKPLEFDETNLEMLTVFLFTTVFYFVCLIVAIIGVLFNIKFRLPPPYSQMGRYKSGTNVIGNNRYIRALRLIGLLLLGSSPFVHFLALPFILYSHAHSSLCPTEQALTQNANAELFVNANIEHFEVEQILDFLNGIRPEQRELNKQNCQTSIETIQGLWVSMLALAWMSLPLALCLLVESQLATNSGIKRSASFPSSRHHSQQFLDTYATIPELVRQRSATLPASFGTLFPH